MQKILISLSLRQFLGYLTFHNKKLTLRDGTADGEQGCIPRNNDKLQDPYLLSLDQETHTGRSHVNFISQLPISPSISSSTGSIAWPKPQETKSEKKMGANFIHGLPPNFKSGAATAHLPGNIPTSVTNKPIKIQL